MRRNAVANARLALVVGSAACWLDDAGAAKELAKFDAVCCIKRAGIHWPGTFDVWATLHPEFHAAFAKRRAELGLPGGYEVVAPPDRELGTKGKAKPEVTRTVSYRWPGMNASAGSGIYGAKVMLDAGYRVVLAGVPMNDDPHFLTHEKWKDGRWDGVNSFMPGLRAATPHLMGRVKSMSGYTKEILGAVTPEWLAESQA